MSDFVIIPPTTIEDSNLLSSNFVEEDASDPWVAGTYSLGDIRHHNHRVWEVTATSTSEEPGTGVDWLDTGPTNEWAAFDDEVITQSIQADEIHYQIRVQDLINGVTLINMRALEVQVVVTDDVDGVVYDETRQLLDLSQIVDWYTWTYEPRDEIADKQSFINMPLYFDATIDIYIRYPGDTVKVGLISIGRQRYFALTEWGVAIGIEDYSRYLFDEFGNLDIVKRGRADKIRYPLILNTEQTARAVRLLKRLSGTPCVWIGAEYRPETIVYGVYQSWSVLLSNLAFSNIDLDIKGYVQ